LSAPMAPSRSGSYLAAFFGVAVTIAFVAFPEAAFEASLAGLRLWLDVVLPALLPFFAMSEILMGLGVIHAVGVLLEPLMRPVFRIPGVGGFAVAMGLASGYPLGAKISGRIRRDGLCTREEGERLVAFANTADPLFMAGAVAVGMFGQVELGAVLALAHYIAAVLVGFAMRFHAGGRMAAQSGAPQGGLFRRALDALVRARQSDARPFGQLIRDAVTESVNAMLFVGGCIMMFSVLIRVLGDAGLIGTLAAAAGRLLPWAGLDPDLALALIKGAFEITIGAQEASQAAAPLLHRAMAASFITGWSGFSVHAQVAAMVHGTDIRIGPYLLARLGHGILAAAATGLLMPLMESRWTAAETAAAAGAAAAGSAGFMPFLQVWGSVTVMGALLLAAMLAASLVLHACRRVVIIRIR